AMMSVFASAYATPYAASKGGIVQLAKSMAVAWAKDNIQVNAILPGWIDTELTRKAREQVEGLHEKVLARTPAHRWGAPDDFAGIAVFLAAPASNFITGAARKTAIPARSEEHTSELQSRGQLVCRLLLEKKNKQQRGAPAVDAVDVARACARVRRADEKSGRADGARQTGGDLRQRAAGRPRRQSFLSDVS